MKLIAKPNIMYDRLESSTRFLLMVGTFVLFIAIELTLKHFNYIPDNFSLALFVMAIFGMFRISYFLIPRSEVKELAKEMKENAEK